MTYFYQIMSHTSSEMKGSEKLN